MPHDNAGSTEPAADHSPSTGTDAGGGRRPLARVLRWAGAVVLVLLLAITALALWPVSLDDLHEARERPASTYTEAEARFEEWASDETALNVFEPCRSALYGTGDRTDVAVVLLHGLTNCPRQFQEMAETLQSEGMNVVVLRAPEHGIATPDGQRIGDVHFVDDFTAEEMRDWSNASVDVASGLGRDVRVLGLSMGGATAAWTAQHREVDRVVAVAPALTLHGMPGVVDYAFPNFFTRIPHFQVRTDPTLDHAYAGEAPAGAAEMLRLSREVLHSAQSDPPLTREIVVVTNEADTQVDNGEIDGLVEDWRAHGADVTTESFPASLDLPHDVVDEQQATAQTDITYPVLLEALR